MLMRKKKFLATVAALCCLLTAMPVQAAQTSALTGLPVEDTVFARRPIAVMIDNSQAAQPQSGLAGADIVYEAYAEGKISRLMAIFENYDGQSKIGPLRSCRDYFIHWACEYDPIFIHYGGPDLYVKTYYDLPQVNNLNGTKMGNTMSFRSSDRKAPHNAYTGASYVSAGIQAKGYSALHTTYYQGSHFQFAAGAALSPAQGVSAVKVVPGYSYNKPSFAYNAKDHKYYRSQFGKAHMDKETNTQLAFDNVIIQYADTIVRDQKGYLWTTTLDRGKSGYFIANGRAIPVIWVKDSLSGITRYYDASGIEIKLNPGKTCICVMPTAEAASTIIQ